jgi:hypothetical protein
VQANGTILINIASRNGYIDPNRPWAYTIVLTANEQIILDKPGIILDGTGQSIEGLNRTGPNDTRPAVLISGALGVRITEAATGAVVRGIGVVDAYHGLEVEAQNVKVESGYFCENELYGILVDRTAWNSVIGTDEPSAKPVIASGNGRCGIDTEASGTTIYNVLVGTDSTGLQPMANGWDGINVEVHATKTTIGSTNSAVKTVVSGNSECGIRLIGAMGCTVVGVFVGVGKDGWTSIGNKLHGARG